MGRGYGALRQQRFTADGSFGSTVGVIFVGMQITHLSSVQVLANIRSGSAGGAIVAPFRADFGATPARKTTSVFLDDTGLVITGNRGYLDMSGASTGVNVYFRNI